MTVATSSHILLDDNGRALIAGTRAKVTLIVRDKNGGMTPEQIHEAYPNLSLAQIHAALAYYYDHQSELDAQIDREDRDIESLRLANNQPTRAVGAQEKWLFVSLAILMDHHIPSAVTAGLRKRGIDVLTAEEDASNELPDPQLLDRAGALKRVLVSQDRDLIIEAARRQRENIWFSGLIWGPELSKTLRGTLDDIELIARLYEPDEFANHVEFLPL